MNIPLIVCGLLDGDPRDYKTNVEKVQLLTGHIYCNHLDCVPVTTDSLVINYLETIDRKEIHGCKCPTCGKIYYSVYNFETKGDEE